MSMLKLLAAVGGSTPLTYADDVFSAYIYTGNGSTQTITNGIDLAGRGGMVWIKNRTDADAHQLFDSTRGATYAMESNATTASAANTDTLTAFGTTGFSIGADVLVNETAKNYASWTFRNASNFFTHTSVVKSGGSNATVDLTSLGTVGMVAVKRTDSTGSWYVWHQSLTAGKLLYLEQIAAEATLGHITVSGTTLTLVNGVIADGTYIVYAWAHDTATDGVIQCGTYTGNGSTTGPVVTLGWEPQYILIKKYSATENWALHDTARGIPYSGDDAILIANNAAAESSYAGQSDIDLKATGFQLTSVSGRVNDTSQTYIYMAVRRPNKPPTVGTEVYNAIARTGTGAAATVTGVGFAPDLCALHSRSGTTGGRWEDRLRGATQELVTETTAAETAVAQSITSFSMDGCAIGTDGDWNTNTATYINHFFKRAPGVFDVVCDTGTGAAHTISHNLTVAPELMIRKGRSGATQWEVWHSGIANTEKLILNSTAAKATDTTAWNSTSPTASVFTVGTGANVNTSTATYVTYLFATLAGISCVTSFTGNGSSQTINCGFTTGSRFVLIKRTDSTGDWFCWDTVRGIVAGNDGHLSLNTTAAEATADDTIDTDTSGFIVNQNATTNCNVTSATYIVLSIA